MRIVEPLRLGPLEQVLAEIDEAKRDLDAAEQKLLTAVGRFRALLALGKFDDRGRRR